MRFCVVASGSKGNMTYVEAGKTKILIDAGVSLSSAQFRCQAIDFSDVTDVLITHKHTDHTKFIDTIIKKTGANLYISKATFTELPIYTKDRLVGQKIGFIEEECRYIVGDFEVLTLKLSHDTDSTLGFILVHDNKRIGYFTDTGIFPSKYKSLLSDLDALIIEANHNVELLQNSGRDASLIARVLSTRGHLSNKACYEVLDEVILDKVRYVILAHISEECNSLTCLENEIINRLDKYKGKIIIASQDEATEVIGLV